MGTFTDHAYFCKGDKATVEKTRKSIERFQKKNAAYSGNGNCDFSDSPVVAADGMSLHYECYSTGCVGALDKSLIRLSKQSGLEIVHYFGSTDGQNLGFLFAIEHGRCTYRHDFYAHVGMGVAMAVAALIQGKDEAAFATLIKHYSDSTDGGAVHGFAEDALADEGFDGEEDIAEFERDGVIAGYIGESLCVYPELFDPADTKKALLKLRRSFIHTRAWISKLGLCKASTKHYIDGLIARLECLVLCVVAKAPPRKSASRGVSRQGFRI